MRHATSTPLSEAKARISEFADRIEATHERIVVTRNGRPSFVMIGVDDLEGLEATLEILSDPDALGAIRQAQAEAAAGDLIPLDEVLAEARRPPKT